MIKDRILLRMQDYCKRAEKLLKEVTGADKAMWGPEFEFYIFLMLNMIQELHLLITS